MADTQNAPLPALQPIPALGGSITEAQEALLSLVEPEEETSETEEAQPTEVEESQPEEEDESFEEEPEEEEESVEEEEESEETDEEDEGTLYAVTVNGEEREVGLDELLSGYSRQSDYTRKTQELSSDRKKMEELAQRYHSELQQIQNERQQYMGNLEQIIGNAAGELDKFAKIDWSTLKDTDPIEYVTKREEFRDAQEQVQSIRNEQVSAQQKFAQDTESMRKQALKEEHGKLVAALPEWAEPEKQKKLASDVRSFALSQGFSEEELSSLIDHRSVLILIKAAKYDKMYSPDIKTKKLKNKPRVIRAGKGQSSSQANKSKRTAQMKRLRGTGHIDDASALLEDFIDI
jgi:cytochrome oxidase Cu insertion factor (SCO1/SenC/PrrC family)